MLRLELISKAGCTLPCDGVRKVALAPFLKNPSMVKMILPCTVTIKSNPNRKIVMGSVSALRSTLVRVYKAPD